jgi:hypothetical protein
MVTYLIRFYTAFASNENIHRRAHKIRHYTLGFASGPKGVFYLRGTRRLEPLLHVLEEM